LNEIIVKCDVNVRTAEHNLFCSIRESYIVHFCGVEENLFAVKFYGDVQVS